MSFGLPWTYDLTCLQARDSIKKLNFYFAAEWNFAEFYDSIRLDLKGYFVNIEEGYFGNFRKEEISQTKYYGTSIPATITRESKRNFL